MTAPKELPSRFATLLFAGFVSMLLCVSVAQAQGGPDAATQGEATAVDWTQYTDVDTVVVVWTDEGGDPHETTIWLVVVDGQPYIRTGSTTWGDNVERDPEIEIRIEGTTYPVQANFIEDDALRQRVTDAFGEKYGWSDSVIGIIRGSRPRIMHLTTR